MKFDINKLKLARLSNEEKIIIEFLSDLKIDNHETYINYLKNNNIIVAKYDLVTYELSISYLYFLQKHLSYFSDNFSNIFEKLSKQYLDISEISTIKFKLLNDQS
jgi:hypothetical protein